MPSQERMCTSKSLLIAAGRAGSTDNRGHLAIGKMCDNGVA